MPKVVDKSEKRIRIIGAAIAVFAERGYHRSTMQAVAERAGMSKGGVYEYFASKDELMLGAAETLLTKVFEEAAQLLEGGQGSIQDRFERYVRLLLDGVDEWSELCLSMLQVWAELCPDHEGELRLLMARLYRSSADRVQAVLDDAVVRGEAAPHETRAVALTVMAAVDGMILQAVLVPDDFRNALATGAFFRWCREMVPPPES